MLFHEQPTDPWNQYDFKLLEAYQILLDETCSQCGNPVWLCHSDSPNVSFKAYETVCHATKERMRREDSKRDKKDRADAKEKKSWGVATSMLPYKPEYADGEMPTRRQYYEQLG